MACGRRVRSPWANRCSPGGSELGSVRVPVASLIGTRGTHTPSACTTTRTLVRSLPHGWDDHGPRLDELRAADRGAPGGRVLGWEPGQTAARPADPRSRAQAAVV